MEPFATAARDPPGMACRWVHRALLIPLSAAPRERTREQGRQALPKPKGPTSRDCSSLSIRLEKGSSWEYENCIYLSSGGGFTFHVSCEDRVLPGHRPVSQLSTQAAAFPPSRPSGEPLAFGACRTCLCST